MILHTRPPTKQASCHKKIVVLVQKSNVTVYSLSLFTGGITKKKRMSMCDAVLFCTVRGTILHSNQRRGTIVALIRKHIRRQACNKIPRLESSRRQDSERIANLKAINLRKIERWLKTIICSCPSEKKTESTLTLSAIVS